MASKAKRNHHPDDIRRRRAIQRKKRQRRKKIVRFVVIFIIVTLIAITGIFYVLNNMGVGQTGPQSSVPAGIPAQGNAVAPTATPVVVETTPRPNDWSDEPATLSEPLSEDQKISVTDLSITESLDSAWQSILLLGNDSRSGEAYGQTDAMMILSIHKETSQVRLTSLSGAMRVAFPGSSELRKLNSTCYYGGPELAMKMVNQYFEMDIQNYILVNMADFATLIDQLGGVEITLNEQEVEAINHNLTNQQKELTLTGESSGFSPVASSGTQLLNGQQALAYARVRVIDDDLTRTSRQRNLLLSVAQTIMEKGELELIPTVTQMLDLVSTNMDEGELLALATKAFNLDLNSVTQLALPVDGSYESNVDENGVRSVVPNYQQNADALSQFIYGQTRVRTTPEPETTPEAATEPPVEG